ncbi:hypothetical protein NEPAR06_2134 [Nematocida parisii]|uniref:uncharacterized protein n=1 Tax=Nematocida parisii (strain ERTm1 / ATCC PRA-289) TaxID=881290 RepID=UPI000264B5B6|nr:uncharacterized protein NEPG_00977 [Nematocida parisii ERTm1]KAI5130912.1 hypothetical protein NEPAR03_2238 [Nematocida parisii]EIJ94309.1 hypothetical protein NEPG_00977 [Nematocida parisii ERTm1]KAI5130939.1 hypothetical protein NEPAR08_2269 [Nematocida parisii]KAI5145052.1 hypothetical protein NEPAR04_2327 [Nematocida parisii]KAI5146198.1 hypothetical protein NEPAR07_2188 [Nematocida parisii]|eukprot:XP_013058805.1 hypothetical protein NEPG_00977 [Nematocida parisii ERTm1]
MQIEKKPEEWTDAMSVDQLEDLSTCIHKEEILKGLEEEFRRGLNEVRKANKTKNTVSKEDRIYKDIYVLKKGRSAWEDIRSNSINNTPIITFGPILYPPENRKAAYKINLKEPIVFFNVSNGHLLSVSERGTIKIFGISQNCFLEKSWEIPNHLFGFLVRTNAIPLCVADTLSRVLIQLYCKKIKDMEKVFEELLCFSKAVLVKKAFFFNGYLCLVSSFGEMQIFDETLREIPIGKNLKPIIRSILREPSEKKEHVNAMVSGEKVINLKMITMKVSKKKVKMIYSKKSIYEEITFTKNEQVVYTDNILFLKEKSSIHAIILE